MRYYSLMFTFETNAYWGTAIAYIVVGYFIRNYYRKSRYSPDTRYRTTLSRLLAGVIAQYEKFTEISHVTAVEIPSELQYVIGSARFSGSRLSYQTYQSNTGLCQPCN